jgi:hypothetical protein
MGKHSRGRGHDKKYRKCILVPDVSEIPYPQVFNIE